MPRRFSSRRRYSSRVRKYAGSTRRVRPAAGRETPQYTYSRVTKKLVHVFPVISNVLTLAASNDSTQSIALLNGVTLGNTLGQRSSNRMQMRNLVMSYGPNFDYSQPTFHHSNMRLVLVYDKECRTSGTPPLITDVFDNADILSQPRLESRDRFEILWMQDLSGARTPVWNGTGVTFYGPTGEAVRRVIIPINRPTMFDVSATGGAYADMTRGALLLLCLNATAYSAATSNVLFYSYRLTFDDVE